MAKKTNTNNDSSSGVPSVWNDLSIRTFNWGDEAKVIGDQTVSALHYLIDMGAKQAFGDTAAAKGSFVGQLADGSAPKSAWSTKDREDVLKDIPLAEYDDANIEYRKTLADAYFAKKAAEKWSRIEKGLLTVGNRGVRLSPDEQWVFDAAETDYLNRLAKQNAKIADKIAALKKADPEYADESDASVRRAIVNKFLTANRAKFDKMLADFKAANADTETVDIDI